jgi:hypothetical protein
LGGFVVSTYNGDTMHTVKIPASRRLASGPTESYNICIDVEDLNEAARLCAAVRFKGGTLEVWRFIGDYLNDYSADILGQLWSHEDSRIDGMPGVTLEADWRQML